jgi:ion channel-forming bestrophin family protein
MLVFEKKPSWLTLVFSIKESAISRTKYRLLFVFLLSVAVSIVHHFHHPAFPAILPSLSLLGVALGIFLGFRNNAAYDRFWEGRKLWGRLVNLSRAISRDLVLFVDGSTREDDQLRTRLVYRTIAFVHALRMQLRENMVVGELGGFLPPAEHDRIFSSRNIPNAILLELGRELAAMFRDGRLGENRWVELSRLLGELSDVQGGCERIKNTPIPHSYAILIHQIVAAYVSALPFGLVSTFGFGTPVFVLLVAYTFLGLDAVGDEIEEPFGEDYNDLPLEALCRTIEINLRETLGETSLPAFSVPVQGVLT